MRSLSPKLVLALVLPCAAQQAELFEAVRDGDTGQVERLAANRSLIDARGAHGRTALHEAAAHCQLQAAEILIRHGWNQQVFDDDQKSPLMLVSECPNPVHDRLTMLLSPRMQDQESQPWSLQYAAAHRQTNLISMLLALKVDVNATGSDGNRALDLSCLNGDAATTRVLLEHGANPNLRNKSGSTPLHDAALRGNRELIELLLQHGAEVNAVDSDSRSTPLDFAASIGRLDAVKALVEHGADLSAKDRDGLTAQQRAAQNGFAEVADFLGTRSASQPRR